VVQVTDHIFNIRDKLDETEPVTSVQVKLRDNMEKNSDDEGWQNVTETLSNSGTKTGKYEVSIPAPYAGKHLVEVRVNTGDGLKQIEVSPVQLQVDAGTCSRVFVSGHHIACAEYVIYTY
jgi:hypothetical protein